MSNEPGNHKKRPKELETVIDEKEIEERAANYLGSTFNQVWDAVRSDEYEGELPKYKITLGSFFGILKNRLFGACQRALNDPSDIVPPYQKLVHPLGIALKGKWKITEDNPYSGYFSKGSEALVVVRSSVLLYETEQGSNRGFAFACKLFPTTDENERVKTADLFTIDVLAGTMEKYYTKAELTNEPPLGFNQEVVRLFWVVMVTFVSFFRANFNPVFRPLWQIAELGLDEMEKRHAKTPQWIKIKANANTIHVNEKDLRNELRVINYGGKIIFDISVAPNERLPGGEKDWQPIGHIELTESVTSYSCDHCLVFKHPKLRKVI